MTGAGGKSGQRAGQKTGNRTQKEEERRGNNRRRNKRKRGGDIAGEDRGDDLCERSMAWLSACGFQSESKRITYEAKWRISSDHRGDGR